MSYTVYGLREIGSLEIRYIGQTGKGWQKRLQSFSWMARTGQGEPDMREWLESCDYRVEGVVLASACTISAIRLRERDAVAMFSAAGHRLINRQLMAPKALRQAA